jgi:hypothetical protein
MWSSHCVRFYRLLPSARNRERQFKSAGGPAVGRIRSIESAVISTVQTVEKWTDATLFDISMRLAHLRIPRAPDSDHQLATVECLGVTTG